MEKKTPTFSLGSDGYLSPKAHDFNEKTDSSDVCNWKN